MKLQRVQTNFGKLGDGALELKADNIVQSMTGNPDFPTTSPTIADVALAATKFSNDRVAAVTLDRDKVAEKNNSRRILIGLLVQLAMDVMNLANGDETKLIQSGFTLSKDPEPAYITNPGNVLLKNTITSGELEAKVKSMPAAKCYVHQITDQPPTEDTVWTSTTSSRSSFIFRNLSRGKQYWVRVAVIGSGDQVAYSNIADQFAQ
jgi:hypothetical protein